MAAAATAALVAAPLAGALAAEDDQSEAQAQILRSSLFSALDLVELGFTNQAYPTDEATAPERGAIDVEVLESLGVNLGSLGIPLIGTADNNGLLNLGSLGTLESSSYAPDSTHALAATGVLGSDGALDLSDGWDAEYSPASLDLTTLFEQLGINGLTDEILSEATIEIGALAAQAEKADGELSSEYAIAGVDVQLTSPLVGGLSTTLASTVNGATGAVDDVLAEDGALNDLLDTVESGVNALNIPLIGGVRVNDATVAINGLDTIGETVTTELLLTPLENPTGSVTVDLATGLIHLDIEKLVAETNGGNLNSLPANTNLLSGAVLEAAVAGVGDALNSVTSKVATILSSTLNSLEVVIDLDVTVQALSAWLPPIATGGITISGTLGGFAGTGAAPTATSDLNLLGIIPVGNILTPVLSLVTSTISTVTGPLVTLAIDEVLDGLSPLLSAVTTPIFDTLDPILTGVLSQAVLININDQPTERGAEAHIPGDDAFTVSALSVTVLPGAGDNGLANVALASASVRALDEEPAAVDADANVNASAQAAATAAAVAANADSSSNASSEAAADADASVDPDGAADDQGAADNDAAADPDAEANQDADATDEADATAEADATDDAAATGDEQAETDATADANASASATGADDSEASAASSANASTSGSSNSGANANGSSNASGSDDGLAQTGADMPIIVMSIAGALMLAGAAIAIIAKRGGAMRRNG